MQKLLCLLLFMSLTSNSFGQCNQEDWVEYFYDIGKSLERIALEQFPISASDEMVIGDSLHRQMIVKNKINEQHRHQRLLNNILSKLKPHIQRKDIKYKIHILEEPIVNAFSIAGGHLYVTPKMIDWVETEDELAFIIAHEIGHVDSKHSISKVQKLLLGEALFSEYGYGDMAGNISLLLSAPFGQIDEYEADRVGAVLALEAGFDPSNALDFFKRMESRESYNSIEKIIRTHPYSEERSRCLIEYLKELKD